MGGAVADFGGEAAALFDRAGALVDSLGGPGFDDALAALLAGVATFQQFIVFTVPRGGEAGCLYGWHRTARGLTESLSRLYVDGRFDRQDPTLGHLRGLAEPPRRVRRVRRDEIDDPGYRRHFFDAPELGGKLSILDEGDGAGLYLNFYKRSGDPDFSDREADGLAGLAGFVCTSIRRHHALLREPAAAPAPPDLETLRTLIAGQSPRLSAREAEVCARIVAGYSSEAIALGLGVAATSIATYRKRAYAKLGISSQNELFALCLRAAAR